MSVATGAAAATPPPSWPSQNMPPTGAPNVLVIVTDDVGFGASSTFGGPIPTPTLDALARDGLRFNRFHTAAICSPTRAALLTGRTPQNVGFGNTTNGATGYPGYHGVLPKSAATVAQVLRAAGYSTAMFGKAHFTPEWELSPAGPFDRWPTGLGFEYYYGFIGADTSAFEPALVENTRALAAPPAQTGRTYHLEADLADRAISWLETQQAVAPRKPFFVYYATGAAHAPNHAPREWLERFRGRFDQGWDRVREQTWARQKALGVIPRDAALSPRPAALPAWNTLSPARRLQYVRFMETYAASLAYTDAQIGRVVEALRRSGRYEDTMVVFLQGDNGSSTEGRMHGRLYEQSGVNNLDEDEGYVTEKLPEIGTASTYPLVTGGWGWAMNAPFPWGKRVASHLGGTRNGLVISWPKRIAADNRVRPQFHYVSDLMPTILDAAGLGAPDSFEGVPQQPLDGISMAYAFADPAAPDRRRTQVFEMFENMGLYQDGWLLSSTPASTPWDASSAPRIPAGERRWELYDLRRDFSQARDLAQREPARLEQLKALFWAEAERNHILPIHGPNEGREGIPSLAAGRREFSYAAGVVDVPESAAPPTMRRPFTIRADVVIPPGGARGVLAAHGGRFGGYAFYVQDGRPVFTYNAVPPRNYAIRGDSPLAPGAHRLVAKVVPDSAKPGAPATVTLLVDDREVGNGRIAQTLVTWISHTEGFDIGEDRVTAVSADYAAATSRFDGELRRVVFTLD
jgi:arylsulfatase A-like enzyme